MTGILVLLVIAAVVAVIVAQAHLARKRREGLAALAAMLGLSFRPAKDYAIARRYQFLDRLDKGSNRYAENILSGTYRNDEVTVFDYHYETHSRDSKGRRQTHHHHFSFFILTLPQAFPELTIAREGVFSKIAQAVGFDDIDFESHEFSRAFCVRSKDKKFAYDVCNAQMIELLLANSDLNIEIEGTALAVAYNRRLGADQVETHLNRLKEIRVRIPQYLFDA